MKPGVFLVLLLLIFALTAVIFLRGKSGPAPSEPAIQRDTVVIRDTVRLPVPAPEVITVIRYDTVRPQTKLPEGMITATVADTVMRITPGNDVIIPVTRNTYVTGDYTAVVEGYRPRLVSIELYPETTTITNTVINKRSPRRALTVGPGIGYGPDGIQPYIGVTLGFVLWSK